MTLQPVDTTLQYNNNSDLDDDSDYGISDTYYPMVSNGNQHSEDNDDIDPDFMEMDGDYSNFFEHLTFNYEILEQDLQPPAKCMMGQVALARSVFCFCLCTTVWWSINSFFNSFLG